MRNGFFCTIFLILFSACWSRVYGDANVLLNPGFESGTSEWSARSCSISAVTSLVRSGTYSGRAYNRTATWHGIQQNMLGKMVIGQTYTISGWVRTSSSASSDVYITFQQTDDDDTHYHWAASGTANSSGWSEISGSFTLDVNGTLTELLVYVEGPASGVDIYLDDAVVYGPEPSNEAAGQVDVTSRHQVIEGFGAAGAWYEGTVITLSQTHPEIYDILFGDLGLDIYRVRNAYDQDGGTVYMSKSASIIAAGEASLGRPLKVMISCWSPPAYLKSNDSTVRGTLKKDGSGDYMYDELGDWWAESISAWNGYGVVADYINVQNEPDWEADWDTCRYEGTETTSYAGYNQAFEAVWQELNSRMGSSMPKMLGGEAAGLQSSPEYLDALLDLSHVYGYAHHLYNINAGDNPDQYLTTMQSFNSTYGSKPLFQTEYEKSTEAWPDALNIALLLHNSLTVEEVAGYLYWDLFWGGAGGLVTISDSDYTINNDYYGFKHFSAFIHSGWQRVEAATDCPHLRISACISPDNQHVSVVLINTSSTMDISTDFTFSGFTIDSGAVYRTRSAENCVPVGSYDGNAPLTVPARSVVTLSLHGWAGDLPPAAPTGLTATAGNQTVTLEWNDNSEADLAGYNVYRSTSSGGAYSKINASLVTSSDYVDDTVENFTAYYYVVKALDTNGYESSASNEVNATPNDGSIIQLSYADFESGFGTWSNVTGDDTDEWLRDSGLTPTGQSLGTTGPNGGANGSTWYVYFETSAGYANSAGETAILESPEIDGLNRVLTFYYHMYGSDIGTLNVDVYDGTWHSGIWSRSGAQHTSTSDPYTQATVDLDSYSGPIQIRLRAAAAGGYLGDMAIDEIEVTGRTGGVWLYGDFTENGVVDMEDLALFMDHWMDNDCGPMDQNEDCRIDLVELAEMAGNWMNQ